MEPNKKLDVRWPEVTQGQAREEELTHLSGPLDALPDAEVAHSPDDEQTECQVQLQRAHDLEPAGDRQRVPPASRALSTVTVPNVAVLTQQSSVGVQYYALQWHP